MKVSKIAWFVLALLFVCWLSSIAFAADGTHGGPMSTVLGDIIEVVAYAIGLLMATLISIAVKRLADKYKVQIPDAWLSKVNSLLDKSIHYAEEWAKNKCANNETVNSNDKLNTAMAFLLEMSDDKKLVAMSKEQLQKMIEARLGEHRGITTELPNGLLTAIDSAAGATLMEAKTLEIPSAVHSVISTNEGHVIVMSDGTAKPLTDALNPQSQTKKEN